MKKEQLGAFTTLAPENVFEAIALIQDDMEQETGIEFPSSLSFTWDRDDESGDRTCHWWLMSLIEDGDSYYIGPYGDEPETPSIVSNDARFVGAWLKAHRQAFAHYLQQHGLPKHKINDTYQRWHARGMRQLEGDLDANQNNWQDESEP